MATVDKIRDEQFKRVFRFSVANIDTGEACHRLAKANIPGTVTSMQGVWWDTDEVCWQVEHGVVIESTENGFRLLDFVTGLLRDLGETAAYFTVDGKSPQIVQGELDENGFFQVDGIFGTR